MNMILHGIDAPNILHTNTLTENLSAVQEKDRLMYPCQSPLRRQRTQGSAAELPDPHR